MKAATKLYDRPKVGGDILSYCTRCKMELAHVVVAMVDLKPAKVLCKTCKSQHKHRLAPGTKSPSSSSTRRASKPRTVIKAYDLWAEKMSQKSESDSTPYSIKTSYLAGSVIEHSKFGLGIVEEVRSNRKILVLFRDGERMLIHGM